MKKIFIILLFLLLLGVTNNSCYAEEEYSENVQQTEETELLAEAPTPTTVHYKKDSLITDYYPYSEDFVKEYKDVINREFN